MSIMLNNAVTEVRTMMVSRQREGREHDQPTDQRHVDRRHHEHLTDGLERSQLAVLRQAHHRHVDERHGVGREDQGLGRELHQCSDEQRDHEVGVSALPGDRRQLSGGVEDGEGERTQRGKTHANTNDLARIPSTLLVENSLEVGPGQRGSVGPFAARA
jgi:hypothetical protein